jgi:hypothetical protein
MVKQPSEDLCPVHKAGLPIDIDSAGPDAFAGTDAQRVKQNSGDMMSELIEGSLSLT